MLSCGTSRQVEAMRDPGCLEERAARDNRGWFHHDRPA